MLETALMLAMTSQTPKYVIAYDPVTCQTGMTLDMCRRYKQQSYEYRAVLTGHFKASMMAQGEGKCDVQMKDLTSKQVQVKINCVGQELEKSIRLSLKAAFPLPKPKYNNLWPEKVRIQIVTAKGATS